MCVAGDEGGDHGHPPQHILGVAEVETWKGGAAGRIVKHWHALLLHDAVRRKLDGLKGVEECQGHLQMALNVPSSAGVRVAQGAPEQQLEPPVPQQVAPAHVKIGRQIEGLGGVGVVGVGGDEAHAVLQFIFDIMCDILGDITYVYSI